MPTDPWSSSRYPSANDAPNGPQQIQNAVLDLSTKTIPRFATQAARNTAANSLVAAGTALVDGMLAWTEDGGLWCRKNGAWTLIEPETYWHMSAYRNATQLINANEWITVVWNAEDWDTGNNHTATGSTFGATASGFYRVQASVAFENNATGIRAIKLQNNGVDVRGTGVTTAGGQSVFPQMVSTPGRRIFLSAGDGLSVQVWQNSGAGLNIAAGTGAFQSLFQVTWDGPS